MSSPRPADPPDQSQRILALDPSRSILVQAPAGSGKTDLLTRRFLRLLAEVDDPAQIVAITFTRAAAAEMQHRIVAELEHAALDSRMNPDSDEFSMQSLAHRALQRSRALGWRLVELPGQLRISTIDSFCRELAVQQPLLSGLGAGLDIRTPATDLYLRAARATLLRLGSPESQRDPALVEAIEALLLWRDNNWKDLEAQLVHMLEQRDRWMHDFVLNREPDWIALRNRLERPMAQSANEGLSRVSALLDSGPHLREEIMSLAHFACGQNGTLYRALAELADFPSGPWTTPEEIEAAQEAYRDICRLLHTNDGEFRKTVNISNGFPPDCRAEKRRHELLVAELSQIEGLCEALACVPALPPARYSADDWQIVRACFTLLRHAAAELKVVFAEAGAVDYAEVAQMALRVLQDEDRSPTDAALKIADDIHHLLVDEFQDTSRSQHQLISAILAAWPDFAGRSLFVVGDPMQSIYFFRDADAELFSLVRTDGFTNPIAEPFRLQHVPLSSNFRTEPVLVHDLNRRLASVFEHKDGSGVRFFEARPARKASATTGRLVHLHLEFVPQSPRGSAQQDDLNDRKAEAKAARTAAKEKQINQIVDLIRSHTGRVEAARDRGEKYRIAVLGRTHAALTPIAAALRQASIPFRSVDLEPLAERPEVLDALALARALMNPEDRVAWLGVLRAPWCGLSLKDLHTLCGDDDPALLRTPIPQLLNARRSLLSEQGQTAVRRVLLALEKAASLRTAASALGTRLERVWTSLGGPACVDATALANLDLLWNCLDALPDDEASLTGPALDSALNDLKAQPDPESSSDHGVQLMTIHKCKGLEFEVVIVPELQAGSGRTEGRMLSWLERGLSSPDESGEVTEFLIAPQQSKGADRGTAKKWVDDTIRAREKQEQRRIFYVAATRARQELHLFARPEYKADREGNLTLLSPSESLLATAWPAFETEINSQFLAFQSQPQDETLSALAAGGVSNLAVMPSPQRPALLRRLPDDFAPPGTLETATPASALIGAGNDLYTRHTGGLASRALGSAVHRLLDELSRLRAQHDWDAVRAALQQQAPRLRAQVRLMGAEEQESFRLAKEAIEIALKTSRDPIAQWILSPHPGAASEPRWAAAIGSGVHTVRADRVFRAGLHPNSIGEEAWWIVDYKTAIAGNGGPEAQIAALRPLFAPQLDLYARILRAMQGNSIAVRAAIYYPRMAWFDWWQA